MHSQLFIKELLVCEANNWGLMGHFRVIKTLDKFYVHFYWSNMRKDVDAFIVSAFYVDRKNIGHYLMTIGTFAHPYDTLGQSFCRIYARFPRIRRTVIAYLSSWIDLIRWQTSGHPIR